MVGSDGRPPRPFGRLLQLTNGREADFWTRSACAQRLLLRSVVMEEDAPLVEGIHIHAV